MARRRKSPLEGILTLVARAPWPVGVVLAVVSFIALNHIAQGEPVQDVGTSNISEAVLSSAGIREGLNQGDKFFLAVVLVDGDRIDGPHYIRSPFDQEPGWAEASRNLRLKDLLDRARPPESWT